jgi:hypothetical protein
VAEFGVVFCASAAPLASAASSAAEITIFFMGPSPSRCRYFADG